MPRAGRRKAARNEAHAPNLPTKETAPVHIPVSQLHRSKRFRSIEPENVDPRQSIVNLIRKRELRATPVGSWHVSRKTIPSHTTKTIERFRDAAYCGGFSEDGSLFYAATKDFQIHLYDTSDPFEFRKRKAFPVEEGRWTITDTHMSPDQHRLLYSSITPFVHMINLDAPDDPHTLLNFQRSRGMDFGVWSIRCTRFDEVIAGTNSCEVLVYDLHAQKVVDEMTVATDDVNAVCQADDNSPNVFVSGSDDCCIKVWDRRSLGSGRASGVIMGHTEGITFVATRGDGRYLLSNGKDQTMKLWDIRRMVSSQQATAAESSLERARTGFDYRWEQYPGQRKAFRSDQSIVTYTGHSVLQTLIRCGFSPAFSTGQNYVFTGSSDGIVRIFNIEGGDPMQSLDAGQVTPIPRWRDEDGGEDSSRKRRRGAGVILGDLDSRVQETTSNESATISGAEFQSLLQSIGEVECDDEDSDWEDVESEKDGSNDDEDEEYEEEIEFESNDEDPTDEVDPRIQRERELLLELLEAAQVPRRKRVGTRDVAWHPTMPVIVSCNWISSVSYNSTGSIMLHQWTL